MNRKIHPPTGTDLVCKNWEIEAAYRMIQHNLDPDVAELPDELIVYGGKGKAARNWDSFDSILETLKRLEPDETLLIQSGKPVGVAKTHVYSPRVLIANSNLVPKWANWEHFNKLEQDGLMMYGQMTAGSWIYIGTQGILQGTYETFMAAAKKHWGKSNLKGKLVLTAGLGGMGGAQPLAVKMAGGVIICIEIDAHRIQRRIETKYLDESTDSLDSALNMAQDALKNKIPMSIGLLGNAADIIPQIANNDYVPDIVTDQTSAHDPARGYLPKGWSVAEWKYKQESNPKEVEKAAKNTIRDHVASMVKFWKLGVPTLDYGNNIRQVAQDEGLKDAFSFPGFVPAYIRPLFCRGIGPFRWCALSGDPEDIYKTDELALKMFSDDKALCDWIRMANEKVEFHEKLPDLL